ncbi:METTL5 family protein [Salinarchaeum sp. IM2453]|uniref:METTL5 family protein n=1 Tax=Salinarchaeum sp. IM2453 TaxID=2862870 RepID=UPI001C8368F1|nr:METTL5 family protein [Salinarchaeum sp. IM2453]QZA88158.1 METTL5 family protein [Salinarchaeum sp. IM2453]
MSTRRSLAQRLGVVAGFDDPLVDLEQYTTPPELAASIVHVADLHEDIENQTVIDLGSGTGMLALAAALRGPDRVIGVELDRDALSTAIKNRQRIATNTSVDWICADARNPPLSTKRSQTTVLMNPPFGAQDGNEGADRSFLKTAKSLARVSYSVHNAGSQEFVNAFVEELGGEVTHEFAAELDVDHQFAFHEKATKSIDAEVFRIVWG